MNPQPTTSETPTNTEQYRVTGEDVMTQIKHLVHEGNVRKVVIKSPEGHTIVEFPLTVGVVGAALAPVWAAIGAVVALVTDCTIEVEKRA